MVPGLAVDHEKFSTPPSSPVLATRTLRVITSDSDDSNTLSATPSRISDLNDIPQQLRESASSYTGRESHLVIETIRSFNNIMVSLSVSLSLPPSPPLLSLSGI